jgi:hypothetical protein
MPTTYKVLGQSYPSAATDTTLYTVPASTSTVVSTVHCFNSGDNNSYVDIAVRPAGATIESKHYLLKNVQIAAGESLSLTIGITLATTDVITVRSLLATVAFQAFGSEIS